MVRAPRRRRRRRRVGRDGRDENRHNVILQVPGRTNSCGPRALGERERCDLSVKCGEGAKSAQRTGVEITQVPAAGPPIGPFRARGLSEGFAAHCARPSRSPHAAASAAAQHESEKTVSCICAAAASSRSRMPLSALGLGPRRACEVTGCTTRLWV